MLAFRLFLCEIRDTYFCIPLFCLYCTVTGETVLVPALLTGGGGGVTLGNWGVGCIRRWCANWKGCLLYRPGAVRTGERSILYRPGCVRTVGGVNPVPARPCANWKWGESCTARLCAKLEGGGSANSTRPIQCRIACLAGVHTWRLYRGQGGPTVCQRVGGWGGVLSRYCHFSAGVAGGFEVWSEGAAATSREGRWRLKREGDEG